MKLLVILILFPSLAFAEPWSERQQKDAYIKQHNGVRYETGIATRNKQVEFGDAKDYQETFDRAKANSNGKQPAAIIQATPLQMHKIRSEARKQGIELEEP